MARRRKPHAPEVGSRGFPFADGNRRDSVDKAVDAVVDFFTHHAEGLRAQHPELVRAGVDVHVDASRFNLLMRWTDAMRAHGVGTAAEVEKEVREAAKHCRESWHAAIMIGCASGRYTTRENSIDDYVALTGHWWEADWNAIVEDVGAYPPPPRKAGRPTRSSAFRSRDQLICEAVGALGDVGFHIYRGADKIKHASEVRKSENPYACAIVECALMEADIEPRLTAATILKIWGKFRREWEEGALDGYARPLFDELVTDDDDERIRALGPISTWGPQRARETIEAAKRYKASRGALWAEHFPDDDPWWALDADGDAP